MVWACLAFVPLAFGAYSVLLGQDINWDLLNYHLYNAYSFLNNRIDVDLAPAGLQTYFNPILDTVYFLAITNLSPKAVGFSLGVAQGLNFIFVYKISSHVLKGRRGDDLCSLFLALAGVLSVGFLSEVGTTLNDSLIVIFPLISLWIILSRLGDVIEGRRSAWVFVFLSGLIVGIGCGLKIVVAIYALGMCLSFLITPMEWSRRFKFSFFFGVAVLVGLALSGGYWFYKMWTEFGNPVFPQFNDLFRGGLARPEAIRDMRFIPKGIFEKMFYPAIFTINPLRVGELRYEQISWIFAYISLLCLLISRLILPFRKDLDSRLSPESIFFLGFFGFSYVLWLNIFGIYRYLIPIELLVPLLLFLAVVTFFRRETAPWGALVFIAGITAVNVRGVPDWGRSAWADSVYHIQQGAGLISPEPAAVYLVGQPLAWIVPALQIKSPFIQLAPNFPMSDVYWQRADALVEDREGRRVVVMESSDLGLESLAKMGLGRLGLAMNESQCGHLTGYLGKAKYEYRFCEVIQVGADND